MAKKYENRSILLISDMHMPFQHTDTVDFLREVKNVYCPDRIICVGDEVDKCALSFHERDPDMPSAGDELDQAIDELQPLYKLIPKLDLLESNHGNRAYRVAKKAGLPKRYIKAYRDVLQAPPEWKWHPNMTITMSNGQQLFLDHGLNADAAKVAREYGMCYAQGHFHTNASITYTSTPTQLIWGMTVGCSINRKAPAFMYARKNLKRPIISHALVVDGYPKLLIMPLDRHGRWTGYMP